MSISTVWFTSCCPEYRDNEHQSDSEHNKTYVHVLWYYSVLTPSVTGLPWTMVWVKWGTVYTMWYCFKEVLNFFPRSCTLFKNNMTNKVITAVILLYKLGNKCPKSYIIMHKMQTYL